MGIVRLKVELAGRGSHEDRRTIEAARESSFKPDAGALVMRICALVEDVRPLLSSPTALSVYAPSANWRESNVHVQGAE